MIRQAIKAAVGRFLWKLSPQQRQTPPRQAPPGPKPKTARVLPRPAAANLTPEQKASMIAAARKAVGAVTPITPEEKAKIHAARTAEMIAQQVPCAPLTEDQIKAHAEARKTAV